MLILGWDSYMVTSYHDKFNISVFNNYFILKIPCWKVLYVRILKKLFILFKPNYINYFSFSGNEIISVEVASVLWYWCLSTSCTNVFFFFFNFLMVHWERNLALYDNMFLEPVWKVKKIEHPNWNRDVPKIFVIIYFSKFDDFPPKKQGMCNILF